MKRWSSQSRNKTVYVTLLTDVQYLWKYNLISEEIVARSVNDMVPFQLNNLDHVAGETKSMTDEETQH